MDKRIKNFANKSIIKNIKNKYKLRQIFGHLNINKILKIIKYNKYIQDKLQIDITDYKKFNQIEIELVPILNCRCYKNNFINYGNEKNKLYFHMYFNDNEVEIERNYFTINDNIKKIKIIIDNEIKSFKNLFKFCNIEKINFIKFVI